ncbi:hypothetical protein ACWC4D_41560 [Streptomyces sp. NPDC001288]
MRADVGWALSPDALHMYEAITRQQWKFVDEIDSGNPAILRELAGWGLIDTTDPLKPVALDPHQALDKRMRAELEDARQRVDLMSRIPDMANQLHQAYQSTQLRAGGHGSSEYLADPALVNARIKDVVGGARREILAAQPGGPRSREILEMTVERDGAALDRGVDIRTVYRDTVRDHPVTAEYARTMSSRPGGRPARYGTLVGDFERMIIVDRAAAFVSDHIIAGSPPHSAWLITDPAAVAVLAKVFDGNWRRAQPWHGELRPARRSQIRETTPDGVRTSREEREVMRLLCSGVSQKSTANKIGVSQRKLEETIAALKALWGVRTLNELIFQYALSPDRLVDDSNPSDRTAGITAGSVA